MDRPQVRGSGGNAPSLWRNYALLAYTVVALALALVAANLIIFDHNLRFDLTPTKRFTLSEFDRRVLSDLKHNVRVMLFVRTEDLEYKDLADNLFRVAAFTPRVSYQIVDVNKAPGLARQYGVSTYGEAVVESEGRRRDFDNARSDILIPAILQVTHEANKYLYFTAGHGEPDVFGSNRELGYSTFSTALQQNNYQIENLTLLAGDVPENASALVIMGPRKDFLPDELTTLARFLARGGHLLVMLDPYEAPALVSFLKQYHVDYLSQVIVDPVYRLTAGEILTTQIPLRDQESTITRSLVAPAVFSFARGVGVDESATAAPDGLAVQRTSALLRSSKESWASGDPKAVTTGITEYRAGRDLKGPVAVGIEVDLAPPSRAHLPISAMTRIVAFGDSAFADNQFFEMLGNQDLAMNAINELAGDEILISSRERINQAETAAFYVSDWQARRAFMLAAVVEPMLMFGVGLAVFVRRRFFV